MNIPVEDYLRSEGRHRGVRDDWEVRTGPQGVILNAWTSDRFTHADQATRVADRLLRDIVALGYGVEGPCDVDARRDADGDWRGHLLVRLRPAVTASGPTGSRSADMAEAHSSAC